MTTMGLPGAGCGGAGAAGVCRSKPSRRKQMDMAFETGRAVAGREHRVHPRRLGTQKIVRDDSSEWIRVNRNDH